MRKLGWSGLLTAAMLGVLPPAGAAEPANPLRAEQWRSRPLIVVAPRADDPLLRRLEAELTAPGAKAAFDEREMVLFQVVAGQGQRNGQALSTAQTQALLKALDLSPPPAATVLLLVGKDGGVKLRETDGLVLERIFSTIDAMPMRQR